MSYVALYQQQCRTVGRASSSSHSLHGLDAHTSSELCQCSSLRHSCVHVPVNVTCAGTTLCQQQQQQPQATTAHLPRAVKGAMQASNCIKCSRARYGCAAAAGALSSKGLVRIPWQQQQQQRRRQCRSYLPTPQTSTRQKVLCGVSGVLNTRYTGCTIPAMRLAAPSRGSVCAWAAWR